MDFVCLCQLPECLDSAACVPLQSASCLDSGAYLSATALVQQRQMPRCDSGACAAMPDACLFRSNPALVQEGKDAASTETLESRQPRCFL